MCSLCLCVKLTTLLFAHSKDIYLNFFFSFFKKKKAKSEMAKDRSLRTINCENLFELFLIF